MHARDTCVTLLLQNMYQPLPVLYQSRLFKFIPPSEAPSWPTPPPDAEGEDPPHRSPRAVRLRTARGGRLMIDRRGPMLRLRRMFGQYRSPSPMESSGDEQEWRLSDRWKFDDDDYPAVGPEGPEEQDRVLVDDFNPKSVFRSTTLSLITQPFPVDTCVMR
jgi:enhancer of polycomb-like protein